LKAGVFRGEKAEDNIFVTWISVKFPPSSQNRCSGMGKTSEKHNKDEQKALEQSLYKKQRSGFTLKN